jgi:alkylation response protein AidB-like acyl-CoA dehydrogenase
MAFRFDEDQTALADGVEDLLLGRARGDYARDVAAGAADWRDLWAAVTELGIPAMAVPEDRGGLGLGPIELVAVCERVGRHLAPAPIVATAGGFAPTVKAATGAAPALLERVAAGAAATLAYVDPADPATIELRDGSLFAAAVPVPDADRVDLIGFVALGPDGEARSLAVLEADLVALAPVEGVDRTRPLALASVDGAAVTAIPLPGGTAALSVAFATAAAELVGMGARMLELAVEHARERHQFGVPIGSFQAVKHRLVDALLALERARSLTYRAAVACADGEGDAAPRAARMAKAAASDAATEVGRTAVQVHGGLGITVEADVSLFYLRARQASMQLGGRDAHYAALAARGSTG